jgi:dephospho-CoA kinase
MPYTIALTGNIACGKSSVGKLIIALGADYLDTDRVVHEILAGPSPQVKLIIERFGESTRGADGGINRPALGAIVFSDPAALWDLERILHPSVEEVVRERIRNTPAAVLVIDGVKIFETGLAGELDELWVVTCSEEAQRDRLARDRGMSPSDIDARLRSQPPLEAKLASADLVSDNSGTPVDTATQVERAFQAIRRKIAAT